MCFVNNSKSLLDKDKIMRKKGLVTISDHFGLKKEILSNPFFRSRVVNRKRISSHYSPITNTLPTGGNPDVRWPHKNNMEYTCCQ